MAERLDVRKTYKLYVGGAFPRSESGRSYVVTDAKGRFLANAASASRKDCRDAVVAARGAVSGWSGATAYNRGQVLYRVAEVLEGRRAQFAAEVVAAEGLAARAADAAVTAAIDRWVWYAGWSDKIAQIDGSSNPAAGPYFTSPCPNRSAWWRCWLQPGRRSRLWSGSARHRERNTCVVVASSERPLPAVTLGEVLATSDPPGGVVNILTGPLAELAPVLAAHLDVNALDATGTAGDAALAPELEQQAAENVKRCGRRRPPSPMDGGAGPPPHADLLRDKDRLAPGWHLSRCGACSAPTRFARTVPRALGRLPPCGAAWLSRSTTTGPGHPSTTIGGSVATSTTSGPSSPPPGRSRWRRWVTRSTASPPPATCWSWPPAPASSPPCSWPTPST
jgi:hypothetical protein